MGCLPGFQAIGFAAPALLVLLRFIQGFAVGGEWGGAVLLIAEHSPPDRRGYWASYPQSAACIGNVLASIVLFGLSSLLSKEAFLDWGWRVAFWLSGIIVFVGYYIRRSVEDAPIFVESYRRQKEARKKAASLKDALAAYPGKTFFSILLRVGENTVYYVIVVFSITYLTVHAKLPSQTVMFIMFIANIFQFFSMLFGGYLSDRIGRKACIALGYAGLLVWAFLYFPGLDSGSNVHILESSAWGCSSRRSATVRRRRTSRRSSRPRCAMPAHRSATRSRPSWPVRSRRWSRPCCCATTAAPDPS